MRNFSIILFECVLYNEKLYGYVLKMKTDLSHHISIKN
ncbi:hypothetical protein LEP1GSC016_1201 [Leptospira borgpetersenii serovar Hardjo-bovis str. Sponselee]|uniref:Uncharacterized protein n=6 Tax=Leptospira borgpetersenii TaxID=174 RepID=M3HTA3_LEPBO|nr:hypothetical protein LBBP_02370 [Leptospira borgpetersenii serovar Ballum]EKP15489.1 hypothetical protein LEP1GSC128_0890 [Leptospira borgpetersenii str. 200801926]EKQ91611.1 hypothetical protein LEP1GSC101_0785 [Leptospira borgpetersenii str. UI 09149]EKQ99371.1 hypothetical protein LEP1GSC121_2399 [Leptospira borgpetersenii serovar Castellonis str. 200801910]EMG00845.1 hypothetical protein LEP1GSC123_0571 [Leptospira borgpetersenii str. 200701203]EMJ80957.1 hypothetical protein LEP1GSC016